jgi:3alpha(or 20beta)-hydroxysteroid dehydrogenase
MLSAGVRTGEDTMDRLSGKVAIVTGGSRGQGEAHVEAMVREGASVVIADVRDEEGRAVAERLGDAVEFVHLDVSSESDWAAGVAHTVDHFGGLDVLVNNAGIGGSGKTVLDTTLEDYQRVIGVNQIGTFLGIRTAIIPMMRRGSGSIVNVSSIAAFGAGLLHFDYTASKFAVRGMTRAAAMELAPVGIRVNSVHPGFIDTPLLGSRAGDALKARIDAAVPMARVARPDEVSGLVVFLSSDESSYCTGSEYVVDGGVLAGSWAPGLARVTEERLRAHL